MSDNPAHAGVRSCQQHHREEVELAIGRRLWAAFMLATSIRVMESILVGRPVLAGLLDAEVLRRARRGMPAPAPDSFIRIRVGHLDAVSEAGPLTPKPRGRR